MQFAIRRRKQTPTVIIVALIDILIVILIFLVVTTTFKQHPAVKLALPESRQPQQGSSESDPLVVTISKQDPFFYLGQNPIPLDALQKTLVERAAQHPDLQLSIRADTDAPFGKVINVMDAAKAARIKTVNAFTRNAAAR